MLYAAPVWTDVEVYRAAANLRVLAPITEITAAVKPEHTYSLLTFIPTTPQIIIAGEVYYTTTKQRKNKNSQTFTAK